jgi:ABC-type transport system involved in multi-copper enzyme maturation permease subunit
MTGPGLLEPPHEEQAAAPAIPVPREPLLVRLRLLLRPSNFRGSIPGPIFHKDVRISGRKSGTYWIRGAYAALLLGVIGVTFLGNANDMMGVTSPTLRIQSLQRIAPITTQVIIWFELIALTLAGAIFGAPAICEEKRAGTLGTLLTTPLKAWQIVIGKTCAFFVQLLILTLIAAPLLLAIRVFGGVSAEVIIAGTALSLATALLAGLFGLFHSIGAKRTPSAIVGAVVSVIAAQGIIPLLALVADYRGWVSIPQWVYVSFCTPAALVASTVENMTGTPLHARLGWLASTGYTLGLCLVVMMASAIRLRGVLAREGEGGSAIPKAKKTSPRRTPAAPATQAPATQAPTGADEPANNELVPGVKKRKRRASSVIEGQTREVGDHPVLWRELRQAAFRSRVQLIIISITIACGLGALYYYVDMDEEGLHGTISIIGAALMLLTAAVSSTSVISGERESRTWEVLQTTPLSAWSIIIGKTLGTVRRQWFVPAVLTAHFAVALAWSAVHPDCVSPALVLWLIMIIVPPVLFMIATGTFMSLVCRKSAGAAAANLGIALGIWALFPAMVAWLLFGLFDANDFGSEVMSCVAVINPFPMIVEAIDATVGGSRRYSLFDFGRVGFGGFFLACAVSAALYLSAAFLALVCAQGVLARQTARSR